MGKNETAVEDRSVVALRIKNRNSLCPDSQP